MKVAVFDAYGTLFDVNAAARKAADAPDAGAFAAHWPKVAEIWRMKQLEYSWQLAAARQYRPFWELTAAALDYALEALGLSGDRALREDLLGLYFRLEAYADAAETLRRLRAAGLRTAILSNGSPAMLAAAVENAGLGDALDAVLSVDAVKTFKPDPRVYDLVGAWSGASAEDVGFVSANGWDATAASAYGFRVFWLNRAGAPADRAFKAPERECDGLTAAADAMLGAA